MLYIAVTEGEPWAQFSAEELVNTQIVEKFVDKYLEWDKVAKIAFDGKYELVAYKYNPTSKTPFEFTIRVHGCIHGQNPTHIDNEFKITIYKISSL